MATATSQQHDYRFCVDEFCDRFPCRIYKQGWHDGHEQGEATGMAKGLAQGYAQGWTEAMAAAVEG